MHLHSQDPDSDSDSDSDSESSTVEGIKPKNKRGPFHKALRKMFRIRRPLASTTSTEADIDDQEKHRFSNGTVNAHTFGTDRAAVKKIRTLQRYHGGPNQERMEYMEAKSPLQSKGLAVSAEQVSIYLTSGNFQIH